MRVLIACDTSDVIRDAFRAKGHEAYSCDPEPSVSGSPYHIEDDVLKHLKGWDFIIARPPGTFLAGSASRWLYSPLYPYRRQNQAEALAFFLKLYLAPCYKIAVESPIGVISTQYQKPKQIIQPWQFGHPESKANCLWLRGVPRLKPTKVLLKPLGTVWDNQTLSGQNALLPSPKRPFLRSLPYPGIVQAMVEQWGDLPWKYPPFPEQ